MKFNSVAVKLLGPLATFLNINHVQSSNIAQNDFTSIGCTTDISSCTPFSIFMGLTASSYMTITEEVIIPCHECVTMEEFQNGEHLYLSAGMNVQGALYFPSFTKITVTTTHMVVEGHLAMHSDSIVDGVPDVIVNMTGYEDYQFRPNPINAAACVTDTTDSCDLGKKAIVVAGGTVDIKAIPDTCPTWTFLQDVVLAPPPDPTDYPRPIPFPSGCSATIMEEDFSSGAGRWKSSLGAVHSLETQDSYDGSQYLKVTSRKREWQGAYMTFNASLSSCIVPDQTYLIRAMMRLTNNGVNSACSTTGEKCVGIAIHNMGAEEDLEWKIMYTMPAGGAVPDGDWFNFTAPITFTGSDVDENGIYHMLYFSGPEEGIDISMNDVVMIAPPASTFPTPGDVCTSLVRNSGADADPFFTYPMYPVGNRKAHLSIGYDGENLYFKLTSREKQFSSIETDIVTECIEAFSIYEFAARIWIQSTNVTTVRFTLKTTPIYATDEDPYETETIGDCPPANIETGWVECKRSFMFLEKHATATNLQVFFVAEDDGTSDIYFDDIQLTLLYSPVSELKVPSNVAECWGVGSELLITSYTMELEDTNVNRITDIKIEGDNAVLSLETKMQKHTSVAEDPDYPVEVASLSREIQFTHDGFDPLHPNEHGGHFMIMHTPETPQLVQGVEFRGFGQQGNLGRYPIHYHISGNNPGSRISKNTIRDSFQRCIVIHATHNVTIFENIAYNTFGHCFMVEDGFEQDNVFQRNLGAMTKITPDTGILSVAESDMFASTFWISNPKNHFIENVCAGSEDIGFWYEFIETIRGPSVMFDPYFEINPSTFYFGSFRDNIVHSNVGDGFKLYPNGYFPEKEAIFENLKSYRNKGDGVLLHNSANLAVDGGLFADNRQQIEVDKEADAVRVSNAKVIGYSENFKFVVEAANKKSHCPAHRPLVGIQLHSFLRFRDSRGYLIENVEFENFGEEATGGCKGSVGIDLDPQIRDGHYDAYSVFKNLTFIPEDMPISEKFNICQLHESGIKDLAIQDMTGDLNPTGSNNPGYIVSNSTLMTTFLGNCHPMEGSCAFYCEVSSGGEPLCIRSLNLAVSQAIGYEDMVLEVNDGNKINTFYGYFENRTKTDAQGNEVEHIFDNYIFQRRRYFTPILPQGMYTMRFMQNGQPAWPRFVEWIWEDAPNCTGYITNTDVSLEIPPPVEECTSKIVLNNNLEEGTINHWMHTGGEIEIVSPGYNSEFAISSVHRKGAWQGPGQFLDNRCFSEGQQLEFTARYRMKDIESGEFYACDFSSQAYMGLTSCPRITLRMRKLLGNEIGDEVDTTYAYPVADSVGPTTDGWNLLYGVITVTQIMADADTVFMFVERGQADANIIVDDVTIIPTVVGCKDSSFNRNFESGDTRWWTVMGHVSIALVSPGYNSDYALATTYRDSYWASMTQEINTDCLLEGMIYSLSSMVKLDKAGKPFVCDPAITWGVVETLNQVCPVMTLKVWHGNMTSLQEVSRVSPEFYTSGDWNYMSGEFIATSELVNADKIMVFWQKVVEEVTITVDDFSLQAAEILGCDQVIWNGDAESGDTRFWNKHGSGITEIWEGGAGGSAYAVAVKSRDSVNDGVMQRIDSNCLVEGAVYEISAKVKMLQSDGVTPSGCDYAATNDFSTPGRCPLISISAQSPGSVHQSRIVAAAAGPWNENEWNIVVGSFTWFPNEIHADSLLMYINKAPPGVIILVDDFKLNEMALIEEGVDFYDNYTSPGITDGI